MAKGKETQEATEPPHILLRLALVILNEHSIGIIKQV